MLKCLEKERTILFIFSRNEFIQKFVRTQTPVIIEGCPYEQFEEYDLSVEAVTKVRHLIVDQSYL